MDEQNKPFCRKISSKKIVKKIKPEDLPQGSLENGTVIIDDSVTDEQLKKIQLQD